MSTNWQPIETAPKDGTDILLFSPDGVYQACWEEMYRDWGPLILPSHGCGCCGDKDKAPTHWMPLPELPND